MWISRKEYENLTIKVNSLQNLLNNHIANITDSKRINDLLNHLELVEWTEAPQDAVPAKTILITKKEQKKRNKNKQYSYVDYKDTYNYMMQNVSPFATRLKEFLGR